MEPVEIKDEEWRGFLERTEAAAWRRRHRRLLRSLGVALAALGAFAAWAAACMAGR